MTSDLLTRNFFDLFDVPVAYELDFDQVQQRYRDLQKIVHPDKFVNASDQEKRLSMQQTSRLNEAFNTLRQPVDRAIYLLKLKDVDTAQENSTTMHAGFLMEQIEMREALSEVRSAEDPLAELDRFSAQIKADMQGLMQNFSECYAQEKLEEAKELIKKMQFMQKAGKEVDELSAKIEDELY